MVVEGVKPLQTSLINDFCFQTYVGGIGMILCFIYRA